MRIVRLLTTAALVAVASPALAAEEATVTELISQASEMDGSEVFVEGELVGDYGFRDDGWMWTQLNGDIYALDPLRESERPAGGNVGIGIRIPTDLAVGLDPPGGYRIRGPLVRVTGVWKYHAVERQGESFLEVETVEVLEPGRALGQEVNWWTIAAGLVLIGGAAAIHLTRRSN
jgi:hypothetical protein